MTILKNLFTPQAEIIKQIHSEFDSAQEKLLQEAKDIIGNFCENNKAERMIKTGFTGSGFVQKYETKRAQVISTKEQADLINYYKFNYPFQKFVTEEQLISICKKYSLIYAPISHYKENVPDKNLTDIEQAPYLKNTDLPKNRIWCEIKKDNSFFLVSGNGNDGWCGIWGKNWWRIPKVINDLHFRSHWEANEYLRNQYGFQTEYLTSEVTNLEEDKQGLFIAAPKSHFNLKGLEKSGEYGMLKTSFTIIKPKDPIVFRYVKGGIQVITKWGLEASDELIANEKFN